MKKMKELAEAGEKMLHEQNNKRKKEDENETRQHKKMRIINEDEGGTNTTDPATSLEEMKIYLQL